MSVIINELEIIASQEPPSTGSSAQSPPPTPAGPTPFELRAVLRHLEDRAERVRAD